MARDDHSYDAPDGQGEVLRRFQEAISGSSPADIRRLLAQLQAAGTVGVDLDEQSAPPSRRRPRRSETFTYRVRIDLVGTKPPLWRRLELASDLFLEDVHDIIQAAFGWTDSHLHRFASGPDVYGHDTEHYLCPFDVAEGEIGVPEDQVRLDEVLVDAGDRLFYTYDFGDDWEHTLKLEAVLDREEGSPRAVCTGGRRDGPAEDCGGVGGYELIAAATEPTDADHAGAAAEFARFYGDDIDPASFDATTPFDTDAINEALTSLELGEAVPKGDLPQPLAELVEAVPVTGDRRRLRRLIGGARLHEPVRIDAAAAAWMVRRYTWLVDRVGAEGITLTGAGYLPPRDVEAAVDELGLGEEWIGKGNRENQTLPVWELRESARELGLVRKYRGRLVLTPRGRAVRGDPLALWWHLAEKTPPRSRDASARQAGLLLLVAVAAHTEEDLDSAVAGFLDAMGWMKSDGSPVTRSLAHNAAWDTMAVLRKLGAIVAQHNWEHRASPTPEGVTFARAALST